MNENVREQAVIRDYLLGTLVDEAQMRQIEEKMLLDDKFADTVSIAEDKLIEDFLDGSLKHDHREKFVDFFLSTPRRRQQLRLTKNFRRYSANAPKPVKDNLWSRIVSVFSSPIPVAAGAACLVLAVFLGWIGFFYRSETQQITELLDHAYKTGRPFESRISNLAYAPYYVTRGGKAPLADQRQLDAAEALSASSATRETATSLQNAGRIYLIKGNFDQAIVQLEKARALAPANAEIYSDLGAALLEKSKALSKSDPGKSMELGSHALENLSEALRLNPLLLPARFNKALCLQLLRLTAEAKEEWEEYIRLDPASQWTADAQRNLASLNALGQSTSSAKEVLQDFMQAYDNKEPDRAYQIVSRNREMILGKLIPQQLAFLILTGPEAERSRYQSALAYLGQMEKERSGDLFVQDLAQFYSSLAEENRSVLREAQEEVKEGYRRCLENNCRDALSSFDNAQQLFTKAGDILEARLCDYWFGYVLFNSNKIAESTEKLKELSDFAQSRNYKWLLAQAFSWLAVNMFSSKNLSYSLEYNRKALALSEETSDFYLTEKVSTQISNTYQLMGNYSRAVDSISRSLELAMLPEASPRQMARDYDSAARLFFAMKNYHTAFAFKKEAVEAASKTKEDTFFITSYTVMGLIYGAQGNYKDAFESLNKSLEVAAGLQNEALRKKHLAAGKLQLAHIQRRAGNCREALKNYDEAVSFFDNGEYRPFSYDAHKGRLLCYYENNDDDDFQAELPVILKLFNDYRETIVEEESRDMFFNNEQSVYDFAISHEFERRNYVDAFDYSEESRARTLLDLQNSSIAASKKVAGEDIKLPSETDIAATNEVRGQKISSPPVTVKPLKLQEIRARMPDRVQIVQYAVLADKTLIWLITKDDLTVVRADITNSELDEIISEYLGSISNNDPSNIEKRKETAKKLYELLITPIEGKLDAGKEICLIPDKILFRLPFSTLISPENGNYFLANYGSFVSPSASIFLISSDKARELGRSTDEQLLSIGNPDFDKEAFKELSSLDDLSDAEREANSIARLYPHNVPLTGKSASKNAVEKELGSASVIHFAGHYLVNEAQPALSGLVLAKDDQSSELKDSLLANHEIMQGKLLNARLVVLSACQSGVEKFYNGEGMVGSSRAFLAMGVPLVVASQWKVDSYATAELMTRFHRYRKQNGFSTVDALRRAQLDMLDPQNSLYSDPYYWAAFEAIGGHAEF